LNSLCNSLGVVHYEVADFMTMMTSRLGSCFSAYFSFWAIKMCIFLDSDQKLSTLIFRARPPPSHLLWKIEEINIPSIRWMLMYIETLNIVDERIEGLCGWWYKRSTVHLNIIFFVVRHRIACGKTTLSGTWCNHALGDVLVCNILDACQLRSSSSAMPCYTFFHSFSFFCLFVL